MDTTNSFKSKRDYMKDKTNYATCKEPRSEKTRKLTVENTSKNSNPDIDKQISELEILIKKLQDEIVEMSNNSDDVARNYAEHCDIHQEGNEDTDVHVLTSKHSDLNDTSRRCGEKDIKLESAVISKVTPSQVYPITIKDMGLNLINQSKNFADQVSNLINHNCDHLNTEDTFNDIRRQFSILWDNAEKPSSSNGNYDNIVKNEEDKKND